MTSPTQSAMEQQQREAFEAWARKHNWQEDAIQERPMNGALQALHDIFCAGYDAASQAAELRSLRDSLALAKADVRRYQWLRDRLAIEDIERLERDFWGTPDEAESAKTDAAIDAALGDEIRAAVDAGHMCGMQGFDGMRDECPACTALRAALNKEQP